jgi:RNA polymerase sigma factor (sigma-70 family)
MATPQLQGVLRHIRNLVGQESLSVVNDSLLLETFSNEHEEAAFAAILRRHGPMVLSVGRRVLHNQHDAEDVFQATFLLLARKAPSIRRHDSVSSWLHGVALRLALKLRSQNMRRQTRERQAADMRKKSPNLEAAWQELQEVLDQALQKLPAKYRTVLLLCYLEGRTQEEVAKQLGCPLGTVRSRLAQGRKLLRGRLARQGLVGSVGAVATLLAASTAVEAISMTLQQQTLKAAALYAAGKAAVGLVSADVADLASAGLKALAAMKLKIATLVLLATGLCLGGAGALAYPHVAKSRTEARTELVRTRGIERLSQPSSPPATRQSTDTTSARNPDDEKKEVSVTGRVVDENGKPVAGADVAVVGTPLGRRRGGNLSGGQDRIIAQTKADADGRFQLRLSHDTRTRFRYLDFVAGLHGHGLGTQRVNPEVEGPDAVVKLASEQIIRGRLLDLQGHPAAGVKVHVASLGKCELGMEPLMSFCKPPGPFRPWPEAVTTDEQGRFIIRGLNREQGVWLGVWDERFARTILPVPQQARDADLTFSLAPAQMVEGQVLAQDTGEPIANAHVTVYASDRDDFFLGAGGVGIDGNADVQGRFRLNPFAGKAFTVTAYAPEKTPYLTVMKGFKWPKGAVRHQIDVKLPRGVVIRGKVAEADSGKPVAGAIVQYIPAWNNPNTREEIITGWQGAELTGRDGVFQIVVIPGKGHLLFRANRSDFIPLEISSGQIYGIRPGGQRVYPHGLLALDLKANEQAKEVTVTLRRGVKVRGRVLGPDEKAVSVALMAHRLDGVDESMSWRFGVEIRDGQFEIHGLDRGQTIPVCFLEAGKQWGTCVPISGKEADKPLTIRLAPCGKAVVQYVDLGGKPLANESPTLLAVVTPGPPRLIRDQGLSADESFVANLDRQNYWHGPRTDRDGRITLPALVPEAPYRLIWSGKEGKVFHKDFTVESGKTVDLGTLTVQRRE